MNTSEICLGCMKKKGAASQCPHCGWVEGTQPESPLQLRPGTLLLGQYLIGRMLGKIGGFGITYLGFDVKLEVPLAIKEYLPRELVARDTNSMTVVPHSTEDRELFAYGLSQFLQEARTLARFNHPNVVRVRSFFEEMGTAFLVMDYYEGMTLAEYVKGTGGSLPEKQTVDIMMPLLDGLREVHEQGFLHRDVKPQNIYLAKGKSGVMPILLDFGAARQAMGEQSRSLSVVLTPGYAPFEQYHRKGKYGPWTDVYGAAATMYFMVTGNAPPEATERVYEDGLVPPDGASIGFTEAVLAGLAFRPEGRPQNVHSFQEILLRGSTESLEIKAGEPPSQTPASAAPNRRELFKAALDSGLIYTFAERQQGRWGTQELQKLVAELEAHGFGGITDVEAGWLIDKETDRWRRQNLQQKKAQRNNVPAQNMVPPANDTERFKNLRNGIIQDMATGLMWQSDTVGPMSWLKALSFASGFRRGGYLDWRLPTKEELVGLIEYAKKREAQRDFYKFYNNLGFEGWVASNYWSSTAGANYTGIAWYVNFGYGAPPVYNYSKKDDGYVRAVRSGQ